MARMPETSINLPIRASDSEPPHGGDTDTADARAGASSSLLAAVDAHIAAQGGGEGLFPTQIDAVNVLRSFEKRMPMRQIYRPSLCVVVQGAKQILFGDETLRYGAMECLIVSMELPASGRIIQASADAPYIGVMIDLDLGAIRDVLEQLETPPTPPAAPGACVFVGQVDEALADCVVRLLRMSETPKAIPILYPSLMREICYWLLTGPHGGQLCQLALPESNSDRVVKAIYMLRANFAKPMRVEQLAEAARMSASSFHQHFKALTSMTPLQFQKQLRLLEARRLMVTEAANVTEAAYQVGYESASQFSREYSRTFGVAPKRDVMNLHRLRDTYASREAPSP